MAKIALNSNFIQPSICKYVLFFFFFFFFFVFFFFCLSDGKYLLFLCVSDTLARDFLSA